MSNFWGLFFHFFGVKFFFLIFKKYISFFLPTKSWKKTHKSCSEKLKSTFFSLLPWAAQTTQIEEFILQNLA